ncbi:hypothetical protein NPIL_405051 [Nephila pilipes]|uniref:Uncharacterized protein n=1 Tax=Nephila pilipes TaxID=299642 RepID=A0A8X6P4N9_NEPPI|nr:hypothetical protein NPIL_405051 [Nephila pilipes]
MDLCDARRRRPIIDRTSTEKETAIAIISLFEKAETTEFTCRKMHRDFRAASIALYKIQKYEFSQEIGTEGKMSFVELKALKKSLDTLMKSMESLRDRMKKDTKHMSMVLNSMRSPRFKLCDHTVNLVQVADVTIWLLDVLLQETESINTRLLDRIKEIRATFKIRDNLGLNCLVG